MIRWLPWALLGVLAYLATRSGAPKGSIPIQYPPRPAPSPVLTQSRLPTGVTQAQAGSLSSQFSRSVIAAGKGPLGGTP